MKLKTLATTALAGTMLLSANAAFAGDNQADWTTTLNVKLALLDKLGTDSLRVDVDTDAGAVLLKGTVVKRETRELAETVARTVTGVATIKNDILLEASVANPNKAGVVAGEAEAEVKDAMLETRIRLVLVDKMGTDGFKIGTEAANGVVTLAFDSDFGTVRRQEARKFVDGMEGVTKVVAIDKA